MKIKFALTFIALLCVIGWIWYRGSLHSAAQITFEEAQLDTNGLLTVAYNITTPPETYIRHKTFESGRITSDDNTFWVGALRFQHPSLISDIQNLFQHGKTASKFQTSISGIPSPPPSMLVVTGKTYHLESRDPMLIYDFTNNSGTTYRAELTLEKILEK